MQQTLPIQLDVTSLGGSMARADEPLPLPDSTTYRAEVGSDHLIYAVAKGVLAGARFVWFDMLLGGVHSAPFELMMQDTTAGQTFRFSFGTLNQCTARVRVPIEAMNLNVWSLLREGACLKRITGGDRVLPENVDRITLRVLRKSEQPVVFGITKIIVSIDEPPRLDKPLLPKGPLMDELGQSTIHDWPAKSESIEQVSARLRKQLDEAPSQKWPDRFTKWGGDATNRLIHQPSGFFRTKNDGNRWWLVDPDGHAFWSTGLDCVSTWIDTAMAGLETAMKWLPEPGSPLEKCMSDNRRVIDFLQVNFMRAFGENWREAWRTIVLAQLRKFGFNTVANWSDWQTASAAQFPYVRPLELRVEHARRVFRDFPDVFDPAFLKDAQGLAQQLEVTKNDPAMIGYFLMNEPTWGFAKQTICEGMLLNTPKCATREALAEFVQKRHPGDAALAEAWGMSITHAAVREGALQGQFTPAAQKDLQDFSAVCAEKFWHVLSDACRAVDGNHLNLGVRYHTVPPDWALAGMICFDVFSMNCYDKHVPPDKVRKITSVLGLPVLIGEWHFGALDVGFSGSGIGRVKDQAARGQAYRYYAEQAAALKECVGVHYFTLYDQSALGRFDGENFNIGFLDVCHQPYEALTKAARVTHERMYDVATRKEEAFNDPPEFLSRIFF